MEDNNYGVTSEAAPEVTEAPVEGEEQELEGEESGSEEGLEAKPEDKKVEKALEKKIKKLKLKVDGKEIEESFDPEDDEYLTRQLQMAKAAQKRMQEHSALQKQVQSFITELRKDPRKVLSDPDLGIDLKKMVVDMINEEAESAKKTPQQLELEKAQKQLKQLQEDRDKEKKDREEQEYQRLVSENLQRYDQMIGDSLKDSGLPSTPYTVKKMTEYMMLGLQNGIDVSPKDIVTLVKEEMQNDLKQMFAVLPEEVVESLVGKETINKIRKKNLAKAKAKPPVPLKSSVKDTGTIGKVEEKPVQKISMKDFFGKI